MAAALGQQVVAPLAGFPGVFHGSLPQGLAIVGAQHHRRFGVIFGVGHAFHPLQADDVAFVVMEQGFAFLFMTHRPLFNDEGAVLVGIPGKQIIEGFIGQAVPQGGDAFQRQGK